MIACGFGDRSTIIVTFVCLVLIGTLAFYFNARIVNLERSIVKQNHVLTDFITNVKGNVMLSSGGEPPREICKPCTPFDKIGVSDSESSSNDDSDSDSDSPHNNLEDKIENTMIKSMSCGGMMDMNDFGVVILQMNHSQTESRPDIVELCDDVKGKESSTIKLGDLENVEQLDKLSSSSIESSHLGDNESTITTAGTSLDFKKMKLTQLKDIASSKGIDVKGKKKNELVETLNKQ